MKYEIHMSGGVIRDGDSELSAIYVHMKGLMNILRGGRASNVVNLKRDIKGYQMILDKGDINNAEKFFELKHLGLLGKMQRFRDNIHVIEYMKDMNLWR